MNAGKNKTNAASNAKVEDAKQYPKTLIDAVRYFSDPAISLQFFVDFRWPNGVCCPRCGSTNVRFLGMKYARWEGKENHTRRPFIVKVVQNKEVKPAGMEQ